MPESHHGGARTGAGRKAKAEKFSGPVAAAEQQIADRLPQLIENMFALADGVTIQTTDEETGATDVYTRPPDRAANIYLIDRILGKTTQRVELDADPDGALDITAEALAQAARELEQWREQMKQSLTTPSSSPNALPM